MLKDDFFNAISESCEYDAILDMIQENRDMLLWMYENGYISQEYFEEAENSGNDQWRLDNITAIKANLKKFKDYANNQGKQNNEWLIQNRDYIIDQQKYPVKSGANIQNAPTYTTAFARIKKPLSSNISGIDIKRVTILDTKANNLQGDAKKQADYKNNLWFKKMLVTDYNGQGPFDKFARDYYYGIDKKVNLQSQDIQQLLPKAYNFCTTYNALIKSLETDVNGIINYINKNPITGNQEPTLSQAQLAANKNASDVNKSNTQGMATKPVNADTDYSLFRSTYFKDLLSEDDQTKTSTATPKMSFSSNSSNDDNTQDGSNQPQNQNRPKQDPEDSETVVYNKKKLVCDILKQALNAKMTAAGMLYRDLFSYMQSHVNSYSKKANQKQQQQEKLNTNPNKQSTDQNNTQNGGE